MQWWLGLWVVIDGGSVQRMKREKERERERERERENIFLNLWQETYIS